MDREFEQWYAEHCHRLRDQSKQALLLAFLAGRQAEKDAYAARAIADQERYDRMMDID